MATETPNKAGAKAFAESTFTGLNIDPRKIKVQEGFNARNFDAPENQEHVRGLADSIKEVGVQTPLIVRFVNGEFYLVDGESRLRATLLAIKEGAPIKSVPAIQEGKGVSEIERVASLITRNTGKRLTMLEQGDVFARLQKLGWKDKEIAVKTGMTPANVSNIMQLHSAPEKLKKAVAEGKASGTLAVQMIREHGPDKALSALSDAMAQASFEGKDKVTAKHVAPNKSKKKTARAPFSFTSTEAKSIFGGLVDLYNNYLPGTENRKARQVCINVFENLYGEDWKTHVKQFTEEYAGE